MSVATEATEPHGEQKVRMCRDRDEIHGDGDTTVKWGWDWDDFHPRAGL